MNCPSCKVEFHPQTKYNFLGQNKKGVASAIYWQLCPKCDELIIFLERTENGNVVLGDLTDYERLNIIYPKA